jgi:hypothetical protein
MAKIVEETFIVTVSVLRPDHAEDARVVSDEFPAILESLAQEVVKDQGGGVLVEVVRAN